MKAALQLLLTSALYLFGNVALAYEQATHASMTRSAFFASSLGSLSGDGFSPLLRSLGLDGYQPFGDGAGYFEFISNVAGVSAYDRRAQNYEKQILRSIGTSTDQDLALVWLMYGAIREDDNPSEDPPTPQDVETGTSRPLHHFFDPYFNQRLTAPGVDQLDPDIHKSVDWAMGVRDSFNDPNTPESPRRNRFTVLDAREAMFRALTLATLSDTGYTDVSSGVDSKTKEQWRRAYWATAFRALGDVLHLNQDMAQPQHTRNEAHSGKYCFVEGLCPAGHTSVYEKYMNARALRLRTFNSLAPFRTPVGVPINPLVLGAYSIPAFAKYSDYWSTAPGDPSVNGKGLADYSNRGFFTAAKNFGSNDYRWPSSNLTDYSIRTVAPTRWDGSLASDATPVQIYYGQVRDTLQEIATPAVPLTTSGLWDQFLKEKAAQPRYTLNRLNYDAMADLLLPRAVAYSAGLINFFFRGRIDIKLPQEGVFALADHADNEGFKTVRAKISNVTPSFVDAGNNVQAQDMTGGTFFAVVRYHTDKQYVDSLEKIVGTAPCTDYAAVIDTAKLDASTDCRDGVEQIIVSKPLDGISLAANSEADVEFDFQDRPIPYGMTDVVLQVVYRGPLGSETDAVAVGTIDLSEPTYFTYQNASDYIHIGEHVYTRSQVDNSPGLLAEVQPQACVDYRQSPPRLVDGCLTEFELDLTVSFADLTNPIAEVQGLPSRRFMRIVWLTVADEGFNPPVKRASRAVKVVSHRHSREEKALLNQQGTCFPLDPFDIPPRHSQMTVLSPAQIGYRLDTLGKLRTVNGWYNTSCVVNGDNAIPGTPDDRVDVMTPLHNFTPEFQPYPVTIMPAYL